jgi:hypothetical protein
MKNLIITLASLFLTVSVSFSQQMSLQTTKIDPSCNGYNNGEIIIDITGGVEPYTINGLQINGTQFIATNLSGGQYVFDVTDSNLSSSVATLTLTDPQPLVIQILKTDVTTFGGNNGSADVTILNGTATYNWTGNGSGIIPNQEDQFLLTAGIYNIEITAIDGCVYNKRIIIDQPSASGFPSSYNPNTQGFQQNTISNN